MAQKHGVALSKTSTFQDAGVYLSNPSQSDSVLTWSNILVFFKLSSNWESLKLMHIFFETKVFFMIFSFV